MAECYICKSLEKEGVYHEKRFYTSICIKKGHNGRFRIFAYGENEASISCNFCPNCGKRLEEM